MWTTSYGGGSAINRTSRNENKLAFQESVLESTGVRITISLAFRTFLPAIRSGRPRGVCQTNDVGQGRGVSKKSVFAGTSLMDDPLKLNEH